MNETAAGKKSPKELGLRYGIFLVGLFINSLGVSLITKANLGTSPISSIPYVLSLEFPWSMGVFTILFNLLLVFFQLLLLRRKFKPEYWLQIPVAVLFGWFIDLTMLLLDWMNPQGYLLEVVSLLVGCAVLGFGVYLEVLADVVMLPGESFVRSIVFTWHTDFGITKIIFDASMTVIAGVLSLVFFHGLQGVREGTIAAALLVGFIARLLGRWLGFLPGKLYPSARDKSPSEAKGDFWCIAIQRQYGCGGREIGKQLADKLGWNYYDSDLIRIAAGTTGLPEELVEEKEEGLTGSLLFDLLHSMEGYGGQKTSPQDQIFQAEAQAIREFAARGNCVIVGRCGDFVLRDHENCLRVFLHGAPGIRAERLTKTEGLSLQQAEEKLHREDRRRGEHYRYYTHNVWGLASNYHLTVDTGLGLDFARQEILAALKQKQSQAKGS